MLPLYALGGNNVAPKAPRSSLTLAHFGPPDTEQAIGIPTAWLSILPIPVDDLFNALRSRSLNLMEACDAIITRDPTYRTAHTT